MRVAGGAPFIRMVGWMWATAAEPVRGPVAPSTREMAALLQELAGKVSPAALPYIVNDRRAELLQAQLEAPNTLARRLGLRFDYASELVTTAAAVGHLQKGHAHAVVTLA